MRVSDSGTRREAADGAPVRQLALAFPVVVAVSVALLYRLGAIELVGQLRKDHVDALAALPLVPLQQVLGRGIWVATHQLWWIVALAVLGVALAEGTEHVDSRRKRVGVKGAVGVLGGVFFVLAIPALVLVRYIVTFVAAGIAAFAFREGFTRRFSLSEIVGAGALFAVLYTVSGAVITPHHLPVAKLRLENGSASGALVAYDGSTWYLVRSGSIDAIPARSILSSRIERIRRRHDKSVWQLLF
jgi:hypothetical protein